MALCVPIAVTVQCEMMVPHTNFEKATKTSWCAGWNQLDARLQNVSLICTIIQLQLLL